MIYHKEYNDDTVVIIMIANVLILLLVLLLDVVLFNAVQTSAYFSSHVVPVSSFPNSSAISTNFGLDVALNVHSTSVAAVRPLVSVEVEGSIYTTLENHDDEAAAFVVLSASSSVSSSPVFAGKGGEA